MCPFLQKYTLCFSGDAPSRCSHVSSQQHLWSRKPGLSLMRINPLLQPAFCNRNRVSSSFWFTPPSNWNWSFPSLTGIVGEIWSQMGGSQQQRQFVHLAEKSCPQVLTINFLTIARHSLEERLKIGTFALVVQTIPSLNCLYVKAPLAA